MTAFTFYKSIKIYPLFFTVRIQATGQKRQRETSNHPEKRYTLKEPKNE